MSPPASLVLGDREERLLEHLWRLRFLTVAQLAELLYARTSTTTRSRTVMTQRLVASLRRRGLIAILPRTAGGPDGRSTPPTYYLTGDGRALARTRWPGKAPARLRSAATYLARHAVATADLILAFQRGALAAVDHELVSWECDWQAALALGATTVEPDGYVLYRAGLRRLHALLEVDLSSEHARSIALKLRRYLEVHRAGEWRVRYPVWPLILIVAEGDARLLQLRRIAEAISAVPGGSWDRGASFRFATFAAVGTRGPLAPIWDVVGGAERVALLSPDVPERVLPGSRPLR